MLMKFWECPAFLSGKMTQFSLLKQGECVHALFFECIKRLAGLAWLVIALWLRGCYVLIGSTNFKAFFLTIIHSCQIERVRQFLNGTLLTVKVLSLDLVLCLNWIKQQSLWSPGKKKMLALRKIIHYFPLNSVSWVQHLPFLFITLSEGGIPSISAVFSPCCN